MFIVINNIKQLNEYLAAFGITAPDEIIEVLADKNIVVAPEVADLILRAA